MVYVLDGRGITTAWAGDKPKQSFEWSKRSMFFIPPNAIPYSDEDPWIRQTFEAELAKRGLSSLMPAEAYRDPNYQWSYEGE